VASQCQAGMWRHSAKQECGVTVPSTARDAAQHIPGCELISVVSASSSFIHCKRQLTLQGQTARTAGQGARTPMPTRTHAVLLLWSSCREAQRQQLAPQHPLTECVGHPYAQTQEGVQGDLLEGKQHAHACEASGSSTAFPAGLG